MNVAMRVPATMTGEAAGYLPGRSSRRLGLAAVVLLYAGFMALFWSNGGPAPGSGGRGGAGAGAPLVFTLPSARSLPDRSRRGGGEDPLAPMPRQSDRQASADIPQPGEGEGDKPGFVLSEEALAGLLADPAAGGGAADYPAILRRHIAAHRETVSVGRGRSGTVVVRFRVTRDGLIVDARVLHSRGAELDEAALATLWRSEPFPAVPRHLAVPLEVDVPIDFRPVTLQARG
ncbi:MAG: energy transducer TonB [Sphingobium sp.]